MNIMNSDGTGSGVSPTDAPESSSAAKKVIIKRRTKTGCITCRRRRIKCDEGKPRCNNCIKSKRPCDGYNQRVVFKDPLGTFQPHHMGPILFQHNAAAPPMLVNSHLTAGARGATPAALPGSLQFIAPRPSMPGDPSPNDPYALPPHPHQGMHQHMPPHLHQQQPIPLHEQLHLIPTDQLLHVSTESVDHNPPFPPLTQTDIPFEQAHLFAQPWPEEQRHHHQQEHHQHPFPQSTRPPYARGEHPAEDSLPHAFVASMGAAADASHNTLPEWPPNAVFVDSNSSAPSREYSQHPPPPLLAPEDGEHPARYVVFQEEDAYWYSDDDASMAESDDDDDAADDDVARHLESNDLGAIVAGRLRNRPLDAFGTQLRTFQNFADASVLTNYIPSSTNSPLNDAKTAAVFWYFVNVTGPSISLFERRPFDPSHMFDGQPVPKARQHIWTYTFPVIALSHPALLQAMLALASLQMAKLQGAPATASMKHYHLSLRRVARNYQSASRRVQPATLAATLLLSFYEVWNSDHDKWCKHMWGARAIFKEIPLRDMTRKIMALKRARRRRWEAQKAKPSDSATAYAEATIAGRDIDQVDAGLVARLTGLPVSYDDDGDEQDDSRFRPLSAPAPTWTAPDHFTEKDIETFELITDVFWWYCKMDVYQSILGGTPLLMEYKHWTQAAPRAPFGKIDALYGTYDHLLLLLGRLCQFSSRDQVRKRKATRSEGPPGGQGRSPPAFAGMVPATGRITIPNGFTPPSREMTPPQESQDEPDLEASTAAALREWGEIRAAFEAFRQMLGPDFEPLGPTYEPPADSPFGPALKYRSYGIAEVWINYYMGMIVLHRAHPDMPPYAMVAAGMAAEKTAFYANEVGRIISGLTVEELSALPHVSTVVGSACIESCFPLFVAAVQYRDLAQRHWTVRYLRNVVRLTGWQSANQIAYGCEIGWGKAADIGRGPPYQPLADDSAPGLRYVRRMEDRIREITEDEGRPVLSPFERAHFAVGLLTVEAEFKTLNLGDDA